ncbi:ABC transporter permease [Sphingomonas sp. QA11]|uniref:ABC transporter permease n=1 Tax=Sphingomonas sp. QA11 TaxID=2950605 RepID=UPI00234B31E5|nr:ABC transporter permease [Sphingomonas sp. QA11]WCM26230.1 ABC transporter permease [Sphingomonas sp. QA11]
MTLALRMITFEWRRYSAAILSIAFCCALIICFTGLFSGVSESYSRLTNSTPADLVVLDRNAKSWFDAGDIPKRLLPAIMTAPGVTEVADLPVHGADWSAVSDEGIEEGGSRTGVLVAAIDVAAGSLTMPKSFSERTIAGLQMPLTVAIDRTSFRKLDARLGGKAAINGRVVTVAGIADGFPNANGRAIVFASRRTAEEIGLLNPADLHVNALLVRVAQGTDLGTVGERIERQVDGAVRAWEKDELARANQSDLFLNGGILGIVLIFLVSFGALVGSVIAWQTLKGAIAARLAEFGALLALGVPMNALRLIVIELSLWLVAFGYLAAVAIFLAVSLIAKRIGLPMAYPVWPFFIIFVVSLVIAVIAAVMSIQLLKRSDPAELLR